MFFTQIYQMMTQGVDITMVIRKSGEGLTVSVLPRSGGSLKDEAQNHIVPLTVGGTPQELDTGFLATVGRPVQKACGLISNMEEFEKQTEKAAVNSKASKEQKGKETKEEKEKREKYEKHMKKAEEMTAAKNYKDALTALGQARLYADSQKLKTVDEKTIALKAEMNRNLPCSRDNSPCTGSPCSSKHNIVGNTRREYSSKHNIMGNTRREHSNRSNPVCNPVATTVRDLHRIIRSSRLSLPGAWA